MGFTDSVGNFGSNLRLSFDRAGAVMEEIQSAAGGRLNNIDFEVVGFGEIAPSACNESYAGKAINRRVEVWLANEQG